MVFLLDVSVVIEPTEGVGGGAVGEQGWAIGDAVVVTSEVIYIGSAEGVAEFMSEGAGRKVLDLNAGIGP